MVCIFRNCAHYSTTIRDLDIMKLRIFNNELDAADYVEHDYECLLKEWMLIREQYPNARLYKDCICIQNDVTPKTKNDALALLNADGDYQVLCHAGWAAIPLWVQWAAVIVSVGMAVYSYLNMPETNTPTDTSGSSNNSLAQRQNKHRVNQRVPDIYGTVKSIPDLIAPVYRYYKNNVQVEECFLCVGRGYFEIDANQIKEGETPVNTIEGASLSIYEPNQLLTTSLPQIQIGEQFNNMPLVAKQVSSVDGKQVLIPPNSAMIQYNGITFSSDKITVKSGTQYVENLLRWKAEGISGAWEYITDPVTANFADHFDNGEQIIIENAIFGRVSDVTISGVVNVSIDGLLSITTAIDITLPDYFKKIRISNLTVEDVINDAIDLAGDYKIDSIVKSGAIGAWVYDIQLVDFVDSNPNFSLLTDDVSGNLSGILTDNDDNIDLNGTYTIASVSSNEITLVNPASVNSDWDRLNNLTADQVADMFQRVVVFKGSTENFIGWYYAGSKDSTGFILNFLAQNGIFEGDHARAVGIEVHYQQVINGSPAGLIYKVGDVMWGRANNRNAIGMTIHRELPFAGQFRFRVKRENDNGNNQQLIDDVVFESAYSTYGSTKLQYPDVTTVRLQRLAIGSGTNASELNMIVSRKLESSGKAATSDFSHIVIDMATDPYIGRMQLSELDTDSLHDLSEEIASYFGTTKACEFNYTFDDKNSSYQEMVFVLAEAVFCTARRENGQHYFSFERETANSLILFNHRNMKPESLIENEYFGIPDDYDGIELKWRDPDDNYAEAVIKLPNDLQTNYKTIETVGVTNPLQAHFLAWRAWNKMRFNRKAIEFTGYGETDLVTRNDRIAVVDSTVPILCSGEIDAQDNTVLTLGYPVNLDPAKQYVIHLQLKNGSVDVIDIVQQINAYRIEIARIPLLPLIFDDDRVTKTLFDITEAQASEYSAYLIDEKDPSATFESTIRAKQYDSRFYLNDKDHINELI